MSVTFQKLRVLTEVNKSHVLLKFPFKVKFLMELFLKRSFRFIKNFQGLATIFARIEKDPIIFLIKGALSLKRKNILYIFVWVLMCVFWSL